MMANPPNQRASLLAGLRTGGVRSVSSPLAQMPHTAAPTGRFNLPRMPSPDARYQDTQSQAYQPQTAAIDGRNNRMASQQAAHSSGLNANSPEFVPGGFAPQQQQQQPAPTQQQQATAQAMAMQLLQFEMLRNQQMQMLAASGATDVQQMAMLAEAMAIQQIAQAQQQQGRRASSGYQPPATAGVQNSFPRRGSNLANLAERQNNQAYYGEDQVPMTAGVGGRFGARSASFNSQELMEPPMTPGRTTVLSGGTSLGGNGPSTPTMATGPSKSESATNWRRGGSNKSVLVGLRAQANGSPPSPTVRITPPQREDNRSPSPASTPVLKARPRPLSLSGPARGGDSADDSSSVASSPKSSNHEHSSPTTPTSMSSQEAPLSPREEAAKKLYEGLGFGRASTQTHQAVSRLVSQVIRQPIGPPSAADDFAPKNFASRIRQKAVGGLGVLSSARERRISGTFVEAC